MKTINPMTLQVMYHHMYAIISNQKSTYTMKSMGTVLLQVTFQFTTCANVGSHSIIHVVLKTSDAMSIIIQLSNKNI